MLHIAIDFDGTIVENAYPEVGELRENAKSIINQLYEDGHTLIINTCRSGRYSDEAKDFLIRNKIKFHFFNENCPTLIQKYRGDCRKISADVYIDDRCIGGLPSWLEIYELIQNKIK